MSNNTTTVTIEYKIGKSGNVNVFFAYNEKLNACAEQSGGVFTQFPTRKGWKMSAAAFEQFKANIFRYNPWGWKIEYVDGNAPKPEPEITAYSLSGGDLDGEHRAAMIADAMGLY